MERSLGLCVTALLLAAFGCSSSSAPLTEYPTQDPPQEKSPPSDSVDAGVDAPSAPVVDAGPVDEPAFVGKQLLDEWVEIDRVTSDGHLVFMRNSDLMVWPTGASAPTRILADYIAGEDMFVIRGRFVAVWPGEDVLSRPLTVWSAAGGVESINTNTIMGTIYPRPGGNDFVYFTRIDVASVDIHLTKSGGGAGRKLVGAFETQAIRPECRIGAGFSRDAFVLAGCSSPQAKPRVASLALEGSDAPRVHLDDSRPGVWLDNAGTHALVQNATQSSIVGLAGGAPAAVTLDGLVRQAVFSKDDRFVVYRGADGAVKRANTIAPASPKTLLPAAVTILASTEDARFVVVQTKGTAGATFSDLILVDGATDPVVPVPLLGARGTLVGLSTAYVAYLELRADSYAVGTLSIRALPSGDVVQLSDRAEGALMANGVVYWFEMDPTAPTMSLKAVRLARPTEVLTLVRGVNGLTHMRAVGTRLLFAGKTGLVEYPLLKP